MQNKQNELVTCKFCLQSFPLPLMYAHRIECNLDNQFSQEPQLQQIQHINLNPENLLKTYDFQIKQNQEVQDLESHYIYSQNLSQNQQKEFPSQTSKNQNNLKDLFDQSILAQITQKCEYCNEIFPKIEIEEHYPNCQAYLMIEQLQIEETKNDYNFQEDNIERFGQQKEVNFNTQIQEDIQSDGKILQKIITRNPANNEIYETVFIIDSETGAQLEQVSQQILNQNNNLKKNQQGFASFNNNNNEIVLSQLQESDEQRLIQKRKVQNLGRIKFSNSDQLNQEFKLCSICYMNYKKDEELVLLPCIHRFHHDCIFKWFITQSTCPICKIDVEQPEASKFQQNY
ncbi:unnamed protein product [Paramecium sonneborni]|uniref:RING-type domain-containing protein n=1 Tax=Paramecium sonneborni TaxID=65129 RepID=A0A8S1N5X0_9CILI|nr:unnamed protein product [Paramecium sonneborni]